MGRGEDLFLLDHSDPETEFINPSSKTQLSNEALDRVSIKGREQEPQDGG